MDFKKLAAEILENVGGKENVVQVGHCATRLRFVLKDDSLTSLDAVKKIKGVLGAVNNGGQFQIVIGGDVPFVHQEVVEIVGTNANMGSVDADPAETASDNRKGIVNKVLDMISGSMFPIVPAIAGGGMIKAVLALLSAFNIIAKSSQTYQFLNFMGDAPFYFLPVLLGFSAAKKFKVNEFVGASLGAMLISPTFINMVNAARESSEGLKLLGLPVQMVSYSSSVIPIMLTIWLLSYVEPFVRKIMPKQIRMIFAPMVEFLIVAPIMFWLLGPIGNWLGMGLGKIMSFLNNVAPWIVPTLVGAFTPLMVMTGMHYGLIPLGTAQLAATGIDTIAGPGMLVSNIAQGGANLAASLKFKDGEKRALASSVGIEAICGITEPALYGISLPYRKPLYAAIIGGAVGGFFLGIMKVGRFAQVPPSIFALPSYIPADGSLNVLYMAAAASAISFVVAFVAEMILGVDEK